MISKIKWKNHSVLGNLEIVFTKDEKSALEKLRF